MTTKPEQLTVAEFCDLHDACAEGRQWALANCASMAEAWQKAKPAWLRWIATRRGVLTDRELRLFACRTARRLKPTDPRSLKAVEVAERFADGKATDKELSAAYAAVYAYAEVYASAADAAYAAVYASAAYAAAAAAYAVYADDVYSEVIADLRSLTPCFDKMEAK
jgi:hypothetical protein